MEKHELLDAAKAAVSDRGLNYGKPEDNFNRIAALWMVHVENRYDVSIVFDATDVALMMALMKIARLQHQSDHKDSWVDLAGYAACGANIAVQDEEREPLTEPPTTAELIEQARALGLPINVPIPDPAPSTVRAAGPMTAGGAAGGTAAVVTNTPRAAAGLRVDGFVCRGCGCRVGYKHAADCKSVKTGEAKFDCVAHGDCDVAEPVCRVCGVRVGYWHNGDCDALGRVRKADCDDAAGA